MASLVIDCSEDLLLSLYVWLFVLYICCDSLSESKRLLSLFEEFLNFIYIGLSYDFSLGVFCTCTLGDIYARSTLSSDDSTLDLPFGICICGFFRLRIDTVELRGDLLLDLSIFILASSLSN